MILDISPWLNSLFLYSTLPFKANSKNILLAINKPILVIIVLLLHFNKLASKVILSVVLSIVLLNHLFLLAL